MEKKSGSEIAMCDRMQMYNIADITSAWKWNGLSHGELPRRLPLCASRVALVVRILRVITRYVQASDYWVGKVIPLRAPTPERSQTEILDPGAPHGNKHENEAPLSSNTLCIMIQSTDVSEERNTSVFMAFLRFRLTSLANSSSLQSYKKKALPVTGHGGL
jgi:hypothetical protein